MSDIVLNDHGSIVVMTGVTPEGAAWLEEHLDPDAMRWGGGYVVEPRYVGAITDGAANDGLEMVW
jgi:hypothetical protein